MLSVELKIKNLDDELNSLNEQIKSINKIKDKVKKRMDDYLSDKKYYDDIFNKWMIKLKPHIKDINVKDGSIINKFSRKKLHYSKTFNYGLIIYPQIYAHFDSRDYGRTTIKLDSLENYLNNDDRSLPITFAADNISHLRISDIDKLNFVNYKFLVFNPNEKIYNFY